MSYLFVLHNFQNIVMNISTLIFNTCKKIRSTSISKSKSLSAEILFKVTMSCRLKEFE